MLSFQKLQHNYKLALESFNNLQIATQDHLLEALTNIDTAAREIMQAKVSRDLLNLLQNTRDKKSHQEAL
jgi:arginine repressor